MRVNDHEFQLGLYEKYQVRRRDGSSAPGGKHEHCQFFVLDLHHDPHAVAALTAYAESCKQDYPLLAQDLRRLIRRLPLNTENNA